MPWTSSGKYITRSKLMELNIPDLDIEDFEPDLDAVKDEVIDSASGAMVYGIIGTGQGGGRIAKAFYDLGYHKTVAVNTAKADLALLELPDNHKLHIDTFTDQGAGKDQERGQQAVQAKSQEVFNKLREIFGAKKYFTYVGKENANNRVGVIASLPTDGECASPVVANNAYKRVSDLCARSEKGEFAPLILVDNQKIKKLYPSLTVKKFWPTLNNTIAGLFHVFNALATQNSNYTTFDPADYDSIMKAKGCMIMGVTNVKNFEEETALSIALKQNLEKTLLAEGFDLRTAKAAASIVVGGSTLFEEVAGLMDSIEYGFDTLGTMTGGATVHRGIYEDPKKESLVAYTIVGGLDSPTKRIEGLKKFLKSSDDIYGE